MPRQYIKCHVWAILIIRYSCLAVVIGRVHDVLSRKFFEPPQKTDIVFKNHTTMFSLNPEVVISDEPAAVVIVEGDDLGIYHT